MKATELMIGNIVEVNGVPQRIRQVSRRKIGYCPLGSPTRSYARVNEINPIPITEELLVRNGFDNSDFIMGPGCFDLYADDNLSLRVTNEIDEYPNGYFLALVYGKDGSLIAELGYAKHLHQLQNLCNIAGVDMEWKV